MYNGIGLATPRGSGTNGYVVRNLSTLRTYERQDRDSAWDAAPPKHREPDAAILEHERRRKVEVKCLELQLELEEKGLDEDKIEEQVSALRAELTKTMATMAPSAKSLKPSDTHGLALAKKTELTKMARAFGTRADYQEGDAFDREKQEEIRLRRQAEREERERKKEEERIKYQEQKAKWEAEKRERDRLRRREEDRLRREREQNNLKPKDMPPPPVPPSRMDRGERERPRDYRDRDAYPSRSPWSPVPNTISATSQSASLRFSFPFPIQFPVSLALSIPSAEVSPPLRESGPSAA
ncbi:putative cwf21-domain-containing protein [Lyophyllum shimeji]|uniref:Cwf21-domain-containing protein n=1 Tax=Lyophyllum shimeji TaxID=47721 RepID=A0A9P3UI02_LYOSH|nr:putative cwf21-domain-containing protein [Lyophyllum shimeji]